MSVAATTLRLGVITAGCLALLAASPAMPSDRGALWSVVHDLCVTDMKLSGAPAPCMAVDLARGFAVLKDLRGATQVLLIPTRRIRGIESPQLLAPGSANYWQHAWEARRFFEQNARRPVAREDVGLAVNSIYGRSQNQLHIHIDCVRPEVVRVLRQRQGAIGPSWTRLNVDLAGYRYRVRRVMGADLGGRDPFKLLAAGDPRARADMAKETLAVIGETFAGGAPGFVLLGGHADLMSGYKGAAEDLLDHTCAVLGGAPRPATTDVRRR